LDSGILLAGGGSVINSGSIIGVYQGIHLKTVAGYIKNTGLVESIGTNFTYVNNSITYTSQLFGVQISSGGTLINAAGGTIASGLTGVYTNGASTIVNAGTIIGTNGDAVDMTGGGTLVVDPGAAFVGTVTGGGTANLELSGTNAATLNGLGTQFINFSTIQVDAGSFWTLTGNSTLAAGQTLNDFGTLIVTGNFVDNGVVNADPSTIVYDSAVTGTGTIDIAAGSTVIFNGSVASSITIDFLSTTGTIIENAPALFSSPTIIGTGTIIIACFAKGTRILTPKGEVAVETLREGDMVITAAGEDAPIKWIGTRKLDLRRHAHPQKAQPVRITAGAISHNVPNRDLYLSPDHALYLHGHLIPAKALVNRLSVTQENWQSVSYYHIELDSHAVIFAEGTPVETYLETGNRDCFENANLPMALHPDFGQDFQAMREAQSCAPFLDDDGPIIRRIRTSMLDRAYLNPQRRAANS
ncbi:MAG: Hint domain-containing protein, partial [Acidocella sp.]|nr:Hint domain-containing protein [Acidocella sp.]